MWFLLAVLFLWSSGQVIGGIPDHVLPPVARWAWWTLHLYACGLASVYGTYGRFHERAMGLIAGTLFIAYLGQNWTWADYHQLIPEKPEDFWVPVFVAVNIVLPLTLVVAGILRPVVRVRGPGGGS